MNDHQALQKFLCGLAGQPTLTTMHEQLEGDLERQPQGLDASYMPNIHNGIVNDQPQVPTRAFVPNTPNLNQEFDNVEQVGSWQEEGATTHFSPSAMENFSSSAAPKLTVQSDALVAQFQQQQSPPSEYPNFTQAGQVHVTAPGYVYNPYVQSPSFSVPTPFSTTGGVQHNGHSGSRAQAMAMIGGLLRSRSGIYNDQRGLNTDTVNPTFPRPSPSQPIFNQEAYQAGHRVGEPHVFRQERLIHPSSSRFTPYPRRAIQPSTATTFLGARSHNFVNMQSSHYASNQLGSGGYEVVYADAQDPHFPWQHTTSTSHFQPPYHPRYTPQHSSSTFSPGQRMEYVNHRPTPDYERQQAYTSMSASMASPDSGYHQLHTGPLQNQGATWQAPGEGARFGVPHEAQRTSCQVIPQSNVSNPHQWRVETTQNSKFDQIIDTGDTASSEHCLVEHVQHHNGHNGQRTPNAHAVASADVHGLVHPTPTTEWQEACTHLDFGSQDPIFEGRSSGTPSENCDRVQNADDSTRVKENMHTIASAAVEGLAHMMPAMEHQEAVTNLEIVSQDPIAKSLVPPSDASLPCEGENREGESQSDPEGVRDRASLPATRGPLPSPGGGDEGKKVGSDHEDEEDDSEGEEDGKEDEEEDGEDVEDNENQGEDEKMTMCKVAIQQGWYMYEFLRPERGFIFYHGPPPGTY